jgi:hypothetical protein
MAIRRRISWLRGATRKRKREPNHGPLTWHARTLRHVDCGTTAEHSSWRSTAAAIPTHRFSLLALEAIVPGLPGGSRARRRRGSADRATGPGEKPVARRVTSRRRPRGRYRRSRRSRRVPRPGLGCRLDLLGVLLFERPESISREATTTSVFQWRLRQLSSSTQPVETATRRRSRSATAKGRAVRHRNRRRTHW